MKQGVWNDCLGGGLKSMFRRLLGFRLGQFHMYSPRAISLPANYAEIGTCTGKLKISLVTPVFNQSAFISQSIESVLSQNYPALEYIVMDGNSTDGTVPAIDRYRSKLAHFESAKDTGQSDAINKGFAHATGEIFGWLNGDDLLLPGALDYVARFFEMNPDIDVVYGDRIIIDAEGNEIGRWVLPTHSDRVLSWMDYVPQETLFWRRSLWERTGGYIDTSFQFAMDWDLLVRFREGGAKFAHLPRFIGAFRVHAAQKTSTQMNDVGVQEMNRIRTRCLGFVPSKMQIRLAVTPYLLRHVVSSIRSK